MYYINERREVIMAFQQTNSQFASGNSGEKKKTNFRVGRVYATDGTVDVSVWNSDKGGCYCIISIKAAVGKDPSTGANVYEQKMSGELPSIVMNLEMVRAFIEAIKMQTSDNFNIKLDTNRGSAITVAVSGPTVKLTIDHTKNGSRTVTFDAVPVGSTSVNANWKNLIDMVEICFKKAIRNKLDPEEFAMIGSDEESSDMPI